MGCPHLGLKELEANLGPSCKQFAHLVRVKSKQTPSGRGMCFAIMVSMRFMALVFTLLFNILNGDHALAATTAKDILPWPDATMHIVIENDMPSGLRAKIRKAVARINDLKIVNIIEVSDKESNELDRNFSIFSFKKGTICSSGFGWRDGPNNLIKISSSCSYGSILHEILHALGFVHEQVHPNKSIKVIIDRIESDSEDQHQNEAALALTDYDGGSIMHYSSYADSICNSLNDPKWDKKLQYLPHPSCRSKKWEKLSKANNSGIDCLQECATYIGAKGELSFGQRQDLSPLDIEGLRLLYRP